MHNQKLSTEKSLHMTKKFKIEFYPMNGGAGPLGYNEVDSSVLAEDIRQVMANWYVNIESQYYGNFEDIEEDEVDWHMTGVFIVRDAAQRIVDRVTSDSVKQYPEIATADPLWFQKGEPDQTGMLPDGTILF